MKRFILIGIAVLLTVSLIAGCAGGPSKGKPITMETDIVVIGSGGAGFSAAVTAIEAGKKVIVVEKMHFVGGNTRVAGSAFNAANPAMQRTKEMTASEMSVIKNILARPAHDDHMKRWQENVSRDITAYEAQRARYLYDSPDLHKLHTYIGGDYVAKPELVNILGDSALDAINWLTSLGAGWTDDISAAIGATWRRSHAPNFNFGPAGSNFVLPQEKRFTERGGITCLEYRADKIIMENGRAAGVSGLTASGAPFTIKANMGVILATGGFAANVEMRQKYNKHWPTLDANVMTTNVPSAQGDGILMADAAGANLIDMEWIQLVTAVPDLFPTASISDVIYVNRNGDRFVKEDGRRDEISSAVLAQPDSFFWWIADGYTIDDLLGGIAYDGRVIRDHLNNRTAFLENSVEDLARKIGVDPAKLQQTINSYNAAVDGTIRDPHGRQVFDKKLLKPPYFAGYGLALVHHTMGGVEINEQCQVLDRSGKIIPGLYAAGEVAGGLHGANRLGANAVADIVVFGRIAGRSAAAGL